MLVVEVGVIVLMMVAVVVVSVERILLILGCVPPLSLLLPNLRLWVGLVVVVVIGCLLSDAEKAVLFHLPVANLIQSLHHWISYLSNLHALVLVVG